MSVKDISNFDLKLLVVFDAVMAEKSVKRAAARLSMKAPAVSQALGRLRDAIGGDLFIRAGHGLKPTPLASRMWPGVHAGLGQISAGIRLDEPFVPATETRTFVLDLPSGSDELITPKLLARAVGAPGLQFRVTNARAFNVLNDLRFGDSSLALDYRQITEPG